MELETWGRRGKKKKKAMETKERIFLPLTAVVVGWVADFDIVFSA